MKRVILVVGNETDEQDSLPIKLLPLLKKHFPKISFIIWDPTEELPKEATRRLVIIDTIIGIQSVKIFEDLNKFEVSPRNTVHDFDLPVALKLLKKLGKIDAVTIIGVPFPLIPGPN